MKYNTLLLAAVAGLSITACNKSAVASADSAPAPAQAPAASTTTVTPAATEPLPPAMPGAVAGSVAADRDGDGIIDGHYTPDGIYHPNVAPAPPPAPVLATRRGERG